MNKFLESEAGEVALMFFSIALAWALVLATLAGANYLVKRQDYTFFTQCVKTLAAELPPEQKVPIVEQCRK